MTQTPTMPVHIRRDRFDPVAELGRLRAESPVTRITMMSGSGAWLVTRYHDVRQVLGDTTNFSNGRMMGRTPLQSMETPERSGFLLGYDPPEHNRLRKLLTAEFTVARMRRLRPRVEAIVDEHLDAMAAQGSPVDLVSAFALPVPSLVICELLGVPYSDRTEFQRLSRARLDMSRDMADRIAASEASRVYMSGLIAAQRRDPGDGLLGMLIRQHGNEIEDMELTGVADLLLLAGHETTSNMLGLGTCLLLQHPDQLAALLDEHTVDAAVEELLRYLSVVHTVIPRTAVADVEIGGATIKEGEAVLCSLPSANRDPELGDDMDDIDLTRRITSHLAFGHGIHHCLGAPLARMEMRIAFPALLRRFPTLRLDVEPANVQFRAFSIVYGVGSLPVAW